MKLAKLRILSALLLGLALAAVPVLAQGPVLGTVGINVDRQQGLHSTGGLLIYTPDPNQPGSSVSHWDTSATPNLLMEPAINTDLAFNRLDVTPGLMTDIGWGEGNSSFNIIPLDPPGTGFEDPRPFSGAPGNPADTLGEARRNLFNAVLGAWGSTLDSQVSVDVLVTWTSLPCTPGGGAALAAAGSIFIFRDEGFPVANTWYPAALAEALAAQDLTGPPFDDQGNIIGGDIIVFMNADIDEGCLGTGTSYYYGLDGEEPPTQIDVAPVVVHELAHGLGSASFTDDATGQLFADSSSIYDVFLFDHTLQKTWPEMTDSERARSAINFRNVTWTGDGVAELATPLLEPGMPELTVTAPASVAGSYEISVQVEQDGALRGAAFGPPIPSTGLTGEIACMEDTVDVPNSDFSIWNGCAPASNPDELVGKIALVDRGDCSFTTKVKNAQDAGAIGVFVVNNSGSQPFGLGVNPSDPLINQITIPSLGLGRRDGNALRDAACGSDVAFLNDDRFEVTALFTTSDGQTGVGQSADLTSDTAWFYFFSPGNVELVVKVLDACDIEGFNNYWVFAAGLTDVEVQLIVTDTQAGQTNVYTNPLGTAFQPIQDTAAFATCP